MVSNVPGQRAIRKLKYHGFVSNIDDDFDGTGVTMVGSCIACYLVCPLPLRRLIVVRGTPMERLEQTLSSRVVDRGITHR